MSEKLDSDINGNHWFVAVFDLGFEKYDHVLLLTKRDSLGHRYLCLDCSRLLPMSQWRRWLHKHVTCSGPGIQKNPE